MHPSGKTMPLFTVPVGLHLGSEALFPASDDMIYEPLPMVGGGTNRQVADVHIQWKRTALR